MNISDGWKLVPVEPTEEMKRAYNKACGVEAAKWFIKDAYAELLSAAPTPPEVEPFTWVTTGIDGKPMDFTFPYKGNPFTLTPLYPSPPSPKAEWDADGNPLNLEAAARDVDLYYHPTMSPILIENLRKFLKDQS